MSLVRAYIGIPQGYRQEAGNGTINSFYNQQEPGDKTAQPVALPDSVKKVDIVKIGKARLITPAGQAWDSWFDGEGVSAYFMEDRQQPNEQEREEL